MTVGFSYPAEEMRPDKEAARCAKVSRVREHGQVSGYHAVAWRAPLCHCDQHFRLVAQRYKFSFRTARARSRSQECC